MRRSGFLAIVLLLVTSATAQAAPKVPIVTGEFAYAFSAEATTFIDIDAHGGAIPHGSISYSSSLYSPFHGYVDCLTVVGSDVWISGVITDTPIVDGGIAYYGWTLRLRDGGTPGTAGDTAILLYEAPDVVNAFCQQAWPDADDWMFPLAAGNLVVHSAG